MFSKLKTNINEQPQNQHEMQAMKRPNLTLKEVFKSHLTQLNP